MLSLERNLADEHRCTLEGCIFITRDALIIGKFWVKRKLEVDLLVI